MTEIVMFPGQGSQKVGMGAELFDRFADLTAQADEVLGYSIKELCTEDPNGLINNTQYTQPALYTVNAFTFLAKQEDEGYAPDVAIGHSLGEYDALFAAGAFDFITGLKMVKVRGELMSKATGGGMAAIIGMDGDAVTKLLADLSLDSIDLANLNAPNQTVISGIKEDIVKAEPLIKDAGAKRCVVLPVSGAFHSRYMKEAADKFYNEIKDLPFNDLKIPVIANSTAAAYENGKVAETLTAQVFSSVRWVETISQLKGDDVNFMECGPGRVLAGLLRYI
ncbi:MAG: ACP S-malonyltransferase [Lentisphaeria bacterium]|nr:ACP S-malonyltransferase [Lentisphaeria bacterium]